MYDSKFYKNLVKPKFLPDGKVFVVVWSVLYTLMFFSLFLVLNETKNGRIALLVSFFVQFGLNILWPLVFFKYQRIASALFVAVLLSCSVGIMVFIFWNISIIAGIILLPYFIWSLFAIYLNARILYLNKNQRL